MKIGQFFVQFFPHPPAPAGRGGARGRGCHPLEQGASGARVGELRQGMRGCGARPESPDRGCGVLGVSQILGETHAPHPLAVEREGVFLPFLFSTG